MNIFSLLTKYAAERRQLENQCTLSLLSLLQYYPEFLLHFINSFTAYHKKTITDTKQIIIKPHSSIKIRGKGTLHPDLLIEYQGRHLIVFEMKVESKIEEHQYLYGHYLKCPLILLTKYFLSATDKHLLANYTWHDIGRIADDFLLCNRRSKKSGFLAEFIEFLKEAKMYLPDALVTKENFQYLSKFIVSKIDRKEMSRGLQESLDLFGWLSSFLTIGYERLCANYPWISDLDSKTKFVDKNYRDDEDDESEEESDELQCSYCNDRRILIYRDIGKWNSTIDVGISYGWFYNTVDKEWYFYTSHYFGSKKESESKKYVPRADLKYRYRARHYRELHHYDVKFIPSKKQLSKMIPIWQKEIDKIGNWYSKSNLSRKTKSVRR
jgi:hypothetical protein